MSRGLLDRLAGQGMLVWLVVVIVWLGFTAGLRPLMLPDEGRYVGVAWEMAASGNWSVPLLDGMPYFHKPPLFYWITAASLNTCGTGLFCTRIAPLLAASALAMTMLWFLGMHLGRRTASLILLVLLTQPFFFAGAQFANLDMLIASMISFCVIFAAEAVFRHEGASSYKHFLTLSYFCGALGLLAKGLIGIVLPAGIVFSWLIATRRLRCLRILLWFPGIVIFFTIAAPWFLLMENSFKGFIHYFFVYHHFQRFSESGFNNQQPFWFYLPVLLVLTFPSSIWSWKILPSFYGALSKREKDIAWLMLGWILVVVGFFSIPVSKPIGYIMPALPAFATLLGMAVTRKHEGKARERGALAITLGFASIVCVGGMLIASKHDYVLSAYQLSKQFQNTISPGDQMVMIGRYQFDLPIYLHLQRPAWVVDRWSDPAIPLHDNWKKELFDARQFDPVAGEKTLLTPAQFERRICDTKLPGTLWVWGGDLGDWPIDVLKNHEPVFRRKEQQLWRLDQITIENYCRRPRNG